MMLSNVLQVLGEESRFQEFKNLRNFFLKRDMRNLLLDEYVGPVRLAYQPPGNSTFLSEQISHQQLTNITFLSE
jgi:hypothetical protein